MANNHNSQRLKYFPELDYGYGEKGVPDHRPFWTIVAARIYDSDTRTSNPCLVPDRVMDLAQERLYGLDEAQARLQGMQLDSEAFRKIKNFKRFVPAPRPVQHESAIPKPAVPAAPALADDKLRSQNDLEQLADAQVENKPQVPAGDTTNFVIPATNAIRPPEQAVIAKDAVMADVQDARQDNRHDNRSFNRGPRGGGGGGYNGGQGRKRGREEDDSYDRRDRPQFRRRSNRPTPGQALRGLLLAINESGLRDPQSEIREIVQLVVDNYQDAYVRNELVQLTIALVSQQPCKIIFVAAVVQQLNQEKPELVGELLELSGKLAQQYLDNGEWTEFKLMLRFLACVHGLFNDDGIFPILEELFQRTIDLQTASPDDTLGLELVKIILLTIPYIMSSSATGLEQKASELLEKTDIVASTPHTLDSLVDPFPVDDAEQKPMACPSLLSMLQQQLQTEAANAWPLSCMPRVYRSGASNGQHGENGEDGENGMTDTSEPQKHPFPSITISEKLNPGAVELFPELYFSLFADQNVETVPPTTNIASSLLRDVLVDTINLLEYNRNQAAKLLIEMDSFWAPDTFAKRALPFDKIKDIPEGKPTWKPEDVAIDAVFSQLLKLPNTRWKPVYYHSVIIEACRIAPAAIAPTLGRAIRFLFRNIQDMDLELIDRYMSWFAHHVSNFDFRWKWSEWTEALELSELHPKKAFILGAIEREIRLSFPTRILASLPEDFRPLITEGQKQESPELKYAQDSDREPYAAQGIELHKLLRNKSTPKESIDAVLHSIEALAESQDVEDAKIPTIDVFVTTICHTGSKSLSHVLFCIDRTSSNLLDLASKSEPARRQIISSVLEYWQHHPGTGVNLVDKLLNYSITTPPSIITWALTEHLDKGRVLARPEIAEMVRRTMDKVTNRVGQIVTAYTDPNLPAESKEAGELRAQLEGERAAMRDLFAQINEAVRTVAQGSADEIIEAFDGGEEQLGMIRDWGRKWVREWSRKAAVEESRVGEPAVEARAETRREKARKDREIEEEDERKRVADEEAKVKENGQNGENGEHGEERAHANGGAADADMDTADA